MGWIRRATISLATAVSAIAAMTLAAVAAGGGFGQGPGHFTFSDLNANVSTFNPADQSSTFASVDRSLFMFRPTGGGGLQTANMTVMSVGHFVPNPADPSNPLVNQFGCFVIPDSDFVVSADLQSASLNATVDASNFCPGFLAPVSGAAPQKGGGGGGGGFTFPLTVTITWTGTGLVGSSANQGTFTCGTFHTTTHSNMDSALSSKVVGAIVGVATFPSAPFTFGSVTQSQTVLNVTGSGILPAGCSGGGKGGA